jgi:hypothetical protein
MTITPIAFTNSGVDLCVDADLLALHPELGKSRWQGKESYAEVIRASYDHLADDLLRTEFDTAAYIDSSATNKAWYKRAITYQSLVRIFRDFRAETGDRWDLLVKDYQTLYDRMIQSPRLDYDTGGDGTIDDGENPHTGDVSLVR